jgi:hypothetical protein
LQESILVNAALSRPLYKHLLGEPVTFADLAMIDCRMADSLLAMSNTESVEDWGISFSYTEETRPGTMTEVPLIAAACGWGQERSTSPLADAPRPSVPTPCPSGVDTPVTDENKHEFIFLKLRHMLVLQAREQTEALLQGFYDVIDAVDVAGDVHTIGFDSLELELLSCGLQAVDALDWRQHTSYSNGLADTHQTVQWFWEVVGEFNDEQVCVMCASVCVVFVQTIRRNNSKVGTLCC